MNPLDREELERIKHYFLHQFAQAEGLHEQRLRKIGDNWRRFMGRPGPPAKGEEHIPNRMITTIQQAVFRKVAPVWATLFAPGFACRAESHTPEGVEAADKVGAAVGYFLRNAPEIEREMAIHLIRKALHGYGYACIDMARLTYTHRHLQVDPDTGDITGRRDEEMVDYIGPRFRSVNPRDIIVPDEAEARSMEDYSWVAQIIPGVSVDSLLRGEREGRYFGVKRNLREIQGLGIDRQMDFARMEAIQDAEDGFTREQTDNERATLSDSIIAWRVYFRWRFPQAGERKKGTMFPMERTGPVVDLCATWLPGCQRIVGLHDAADQFPNQRERRPYIRQNLIESGRSLGLGLADILANLEDDSSTLWRYFLYSAAMTAGPAVFWAPGSGFDPKKHRLIPFGSTPVKDPNLIRVEQLKANTAPLMEGIQRLDLEGQRLTGLNDFQSGMPGSMPGEPETLGGQQLVSRAGEVRSALDIGMEKAGTNQIAQRFWAIVCSPYMPPQVTYRTFGALPQSWSAGTGFGKLGEYERRGRFDFSVKYAPGPIEQVERIGRLEKAAASIMPLPIVQTQPQLQARIAQELLTEYGFPELAAEVQAPATDMPRQPELEDREMIMGREITPNPMDDDGLHLTGRDGKSGHQATLQMLEQAEFPNEAAIQRLKDHVIQHLRQRAQKRIATDAMQQAAQAEMDLQSAGSDGSVTSAVQ